MQGATGGVSIYKSDKAIIIGTYDAGVNPGHNAGKCSSTVAKLSDYLIAQGY